MSMPYMGNDHPYANVPITGPDAYRPVGAPPVPQRPEFGTMPGEGPFKQFGYYHGMKLPIQRRLIAGVIDWGLPYMMAGTLATLVDGSSGGDGRWGAFLFLTFLNQVALQSRINATLGKIIVNLRVIEPICQIGNPTFYLMRKELSFGKWVIRWLADFVMVITVVGPLIMLLTPRRQSLGDLIVNTISVFNIGNNRSFMVKDDEDIANRGWGQFETDRGASEPR